jgi:hypothetical protein
MRYVYYVDGEKYTTDNYYEINFYGISSFDENTPAFEDLSTGEKGWCKKGYIIHRLTGPARILSDDIEYFYLNNKRYKKVNEWLNHHPNQDNSFQVEMLLKYS